MEWTGQRSRGVVKKVPSLHKAVVPEWDLPPPEIYGETILWERPIQIAVREVLRAGDTVLDVGGNVGGLSIAFARMVGGSGQVLAFECNPRMVAWIKRDTAANGIGNVTVVERAAWNVSGASLQFHLHDSHYGSASSLKWEWGQGEIQVETITIDDVCRRDHLIPRLIKIDIEGAEDEALAGARETIAAHRPVIVTECHPRSGVQQLHTLNAFGYDMFDVNSYERVSVETMHASIPTNAVCFPREWKASFTREPIGVFEPASVRVPRGRSLVSCQLDYAGEGVAALKFWSGTQLIAMAQTPLDRLVHYSNATAVLDLAAPAELAITLDKVSGDGDVWLKNVAVERIEPRFAGG